MYLSNSVGQWSWKWGHGKEKWNQKENKRNHQETNRNHQGIQRFEQELNRHQQEIHSHEWKSKEAARNQNTGCVINSERTRILLPTGAYSSLCCLFFCVTRCPRSLPSKIVAPSTPLKIGQKRCPESRGAIYPPSHSFRVVPDTLKIV